MSPFKISSSVKKSLGKIDLNRKDGTYSLAPFVFKWIKDHPPEFTYTSKQPNYSFDSWRTKVRNLIVEKLDVMEPLPLNEQKVEIHGEASANGIHFIKLSLMALPGLRVPAILCIPEELSSKVPACICIHGHGQGKENSVGLKKSKNNEYFGYELAKLGLVTLSLDWIGMGERETFKNRWFLFFQSEDQRSNWTSFLGMWMMSLRITEVKGLLNYLETREEVNAKRFGIVGHSGGGTLSLFSSVAEERIKVTGVSGYFGTWEHSILAMYHCGCNYISDLRKYVELYDVFASLAPQPLAVCTGREDKIFPIKGGEVAIPIIRKAYEESAKPDNLLIDVGLKGHRVYGEKVYPFIVNHLQDEF
jgi:dienelactone hydrolase